MSVAQIQSDADAMAQAWREQLHSEPTIHALVFCVAQGTHETQMGRAWPGPDGLIGTQDDENNVGACTLRRLNDAEYAALIVAMLGGLTAAGLPTRGTLIWANTADVYWDQGVNAQGEPVRASLSTSERFAVSPWLPTVGPGHEQHAKNAEAAILAAGLPLASGEIAGIPIPSAHVHCDSMPLKGGGNRAYFTWFAAFASLKDGCRYYLHLAAQGKPALAVLTNPAGTEQQFAAVLRGQGYYTGFADNSTPEGWQKNVDAYANSLRALTPGIRAALSGWQPSSGAIPATPPAVEAYDLSTQAGQYRALTTLGCVRPETLALTPNHFLAALGAFQCGNVNAAGDPLDIDGNLGPETQAAMRASLTELGLPVA